MRFLQILWHNKPLLFLRQLLLIRKQLYPSPTARSSRFKNPNRLLIFLQPSIMHKLLQILWKHISHRAYLILIPVPSMHPCYIFIHVVFPSKVIRAWKMIHLLESIHFFESVSRSKSSPKQIPVIAFIDQNHTVCFAWVDEGVVNVGAICDFKDHGVIDHLFLVHCFQSVWFSPEFVLADVFWVVEE